MPASQGLPSSGDLVALQTSQDPQTSPVFKLAPEILLQIFQFLLVDFETYAADEAPSRATIRASQVCRLWRQIALDYPLLWTRIDGIGSSAMKRATEMMKRSDGQPLHVLWAESLGGHNPEILRSVMHDIARVQVLYLPAVVQKTTLYDLSMAIEKPASLLEGLQVTIDEQKLHLADLSLADARFMDRPMPGLRYLAAILPYVPWSTPPSCPHLTSLYLQLQDGSQPILLSQILPILESAPNLEEVSFGKVLYDIPHSAHDSPKVIELPRLSSISILAILIDGSNIFHHLRYPPTCRISLSSVVPFLDDLDVPNIIDICCKSLIAIDTRSVVHTNISIGPDAQFHIQALDHSDLLLFSLRFATVGGEVSHDIPEPMLAIWSHIGPFFRSSEILFLSIAQPPSTNSWSTLLSPFQNVRTLRINAPIRTLHHVVTRLTTGTPAVAISPERLALVSDNAASELSLVREMAKYLNDVDSDGFFNRMRDLTFIMKGLDDVDPPIVELQHTWHTEVP